MSTKIIKLRYNQNLATDVYLFGRNARIVLIAGMHGNEKSGVIILQQMINELKKSSGQIDLAIIPCANPNAYSTNTRTSPTDNLDLNRLFSHKRRKVTESVSIVQALENITKKFEVIIDLHTFTKRKTLISGVELNAGQSLVRKRIRDIMNFLGLEIICRIDHTNEPKKDGSLCASLQAKGKLAFGIELPDHTVLTRMQSRNMIKSLMGLARSYPAIPTKRTLPTYSRQIITAEQYGLFAPDVKLNQMVKPGQIVGQIMSQAKSSLNIYSPFSGPVISLSYKRMVNPGDKIVVVGKYHDR